MFIGTSGYSYSFWTPSIAKHRDDFKDLTTFYSSSKNLLQQYSQTFNSVEINCTRYQKLKASDCEKWFKETPDQFVFTVKMSLYITHQKKLNGFKEWWDEFVVDVAPLKHKLGCLLFQMDEKFHRTDENLLKLALVKSVIPDHFNCAWELRHSSWFTHPDELCHYFSGNWTIVNNFFTNGGSSGCSFGDLKVSPVPMEPVPGGRFTYTRLHGSCGYSEGTYGSEFLNHSIVPLIDKEKTNFVYFNNTDSWEALELKNISSVFRDSWKPNRFAPLNVYCRKITNHTLPSAICDAKTLAIILSEH